MMWRSLAVSRPRSAGRVTGVHSVVAYNPAEASLLADVHKVGSTGYTLRRTHDLRPRAPSTVVELPTIGHRTPSTVVELPPIGHRTPSTVVEMRTIGHRTPSAVVKLRTIGHRTPSAAALPRTIEPKWSADVTYSSR